MSKAREYSLSPLIEPEEGGRLQRVIRHFRIASRRKRSALFHSLFELHPQTRILDLGGFNGAHVHSLLQDSVVRPANVYVADIDHEAVQHASARFGYSAVFLDENDALPFPDKYFDILLCSSVLEHVTIPKNEIWLERSGSRFNRRARERQRRFAAEIARVAAGYFVQVPHRWFPIETHSWLPFLSYLPRRAQCRLIALSNRLWIKRTIPDFYLPTPAEMRRYFPEAELRKERFLSLAKSLIAVRRPPNATSGAEPASV